MTIFSAILGARVRTVSRAATAALILLGIAAVVPFWAFRDDFGGGGTALWLAAPYGALAALAIAFRKSSTPSTVSLIGTLLIAGSMTFVLYETERLSRSGIRDGQLGMGIGIVLGYANLAEWVGVGIVGLVGWRWQPKENRSFGAVAAILGASVALLVFRC